MNTDIQYLAIARFADGREEKLDLEETGWKEKLDDTLTQFTLTPKVHGALPVVSVSLEPLPSGEERRLVYFSRVFGKVGVDTTKEDNQPLLRLYCLGWQATVEGRNIKALNWVYPHGSVVSAEEPPLVDQLVNALWLARQKKRAQSKG